MPPSAGSKSKPSKKATSKRSCLLHVTFLLGLFLDMKMDELCSSETLVGFHPSTKCDIPKEGHHSENVKQQDLNIF
jgi:hypothetical protein